VTKRWEREEARRLYILQHQSKTKIAKLLKVSRKSVTNWCKEDRWDEERERRLVRSTMGKRLVQWRERGRQNLTEEEMERAKRVGNPRAWFREQGKPIVDAQGKPVKQWEGWRDFGTEERLEEVKQALLEVGVPPEAIVRAIAPWLRIRSEEELREIRLGGRRRTRAKCFHRAYFGSQRSGRKRVRRR